MTSCPEAMGWDYWGFLKKSVTVEIWRWTRRDQLGLRDAPRVCWVSELRSNAGRDKTNWVYGMHRAFVGSVSWDLTLNETRPIGCTGCTARLLGQWVEIWRWTRRDQLGLRDALHVCWVSELRSDAGRDETNWVYGMHRAFVGSVSWDLTLDETRPIGSTGCTARLLGQWVEIWRWTRRDQLGVRDAPRVCWVSELRSDAGRDETNWVYGMHRAFVGSVSWDLTLDETRPIGSTGCTARLLGQWVEIWRWTRRDQLGVRDAPRVCWVSELRSDAGRDETNWVYGMHCTFVGSVSWDLRLDETRPIGCTGCTARLLGQWVEIWRWTRRDQLGLRDALHVCWVSELRSDAGRDETNWVYGMHRAFVGSVSWDLTLNETRPIGSTGCTARLLGQWVEIWRWTRRDQLGLRDALRVCWVSELRSDAGRDETNWVYGMHPRLLGQWVEIWRWTRRDQLGRRDAPRVCWVSELRSDAGRDETNWVYGMHRAFRLVSELRSDAGRDETNWAYGMHRAFVGSVSWDLTLDETRPIGSTGCTARLLGQWVEIWRWTRRDQLGLRDALHVCWVSELRSDAERDETNWVYGMHRAFVGSVSWNLTLNETRPIGCTGCTARLLGQWVEIWRWTRRDQLGVRDAPRVCWVSELRSDAGRDETNWVYGMHRAFVGSVSWDLTLDETRPIGSTGCTARSFGQWVEIWRWNETRPIGCTGCTARLLGQWVEIWRWTRRDQLGVRDAPRVCWVSELRSDAGRDETNWVYGMHRAFVGSVSWDLTLDETRPIGSTGCTARLLGQWVEIWRWTRRDQLGLRDAPRVRLVSELRSDAERDETNWVYGMHRAFVGSVSWDLTLNETRPIGCTGCTARLLGQWVEIWRWTRRDQLGLRDAPRVRLVSELRSDAERDETNWVYGMYRAFGWVSELRSDAGRDETNWVYGMHRAFVGSVSWDLTLNETRPIGCTGSHRAFVLVSELRSDAGRDETNWVYGMHRAFVGSVSWDLTLDETRPIGSTGCTARSFGQWVEIWRWTRRDQLGVRYVPRVCWVSELRSDAGRDETNWVYGMHRAFVGSVSWDLTLDETRPIGCTGCTARLLGQWVEIWRWTRRDQLGVRDAPRVCWVSELRSDAGRDETNWVYGMHRAFVGSVSWDLTLDETRPIGSTGCTARLLGQWVEIWRWTRRDQLGLRDAPRVRLVSELRSDAERDETNWVYGMHRAFVGSVSWDLTLDETRPIGSTGCTARSFGQWVEIWRWTRRDQLGVRDVPRVCWVSELRSDAGRDETN